MSGNYTYYSDGFFGFGPNGTFRPYTLMHLLPIAVCAVLVFLIWFKREALRKWQGETRLRFVMAFVMFMTEFSYFLWLLYVGDSSGKFLMMSKLPLHACDLGIIVCMFMVMSMNRVLFGINFFITLFGAPLACIIPQTVLDGADPTYFRYYQYFAEHLIPITCTLYMIIVHGMRPRYRDIWITFAVLALMLVPSFALNSAFPGSDYMFLKLESGMLPDDQYLRAGIYSLLIIAIFHAMYFIYRAVSGRTKTAKAA